MLHALLPLLLALASADESVRLDLGVGPSFQRFPAPISDIDPWVTGIALDASAAVPASVARARAPARWKNSIPSSGEVDVRPWWLAMVPSTVIASPGDPLSLLGATWDLFGIGQSLSLGSKARLRGQLELPEIWWIHASGLATTSPSSYVGLAVAPSAAFEVDPLPWLRLSAGWTHHIGVPFGSIHLEKGAESPWQWGSAWFEIHLRPAVSL